MSSLRDRDMPRLRLRNVFLRRTDWRGADLTGADISGTDVSHASFVGADFTEARLDGTILRGADLTGAKNLTVAQLQSAVIDETTRLPDYIDRSRLTLAPAD
ncbi:pentapeptide repeat-containing protein [Jiella sonneratiae]|uniref:Pentapeptide repeat-containing protein n=1 Tax=Jiella sonneratiae TaxID=2816856 RepID=A0ABS3J2B0_9HYPH|nr:pentapeptide repeat-containing protein [Jiella sonneratiae]MBO0903247.1 pentapeptide repeat-containing protein [Jiella sonneratiae]